MSAHLQCVAPRASSHRPKPRWRSSATPTWSCSHGSRRPCARYLPTAPNQTLRSIAPRRYRGSGSAKRSCELRAASCELRAARATLTLHPSFTALGSFAIGWIPAPLCPDKGSNGSVVRTLPLVFPEVTIGFYQICEPCVNLQSHRNLGNPVIPQCGVTVLRFPIVTTADCQEAPMWRSSAGGPRATFRPVEGPHEYLQTAAAAVRSARNPRSRCRRQPAPTHPKRLAPANRLKTPAAPPRNGECVFL
jgi:hypothetical protein